MFQADRIFQQRNPLTGNVEWFFQAREGSIGPYPSRDVAEKMLKEFVSRCIATGDDGGRSKNGGLSLEKIDSSQGVAFDPTRRKKGDDQ